MRNLLVWKVMFIFGIATILVRTQLSRFFSDQAALLVIGVLLSLLSGAGMLAEIYFSKGEKLGKETD